MKTLYSTLPYISGDGFPDSTSSAPTIAEKYSFQPIHHNSKLSNISFHQIKRRTRKNLGIPEAWKTGKGYLDGTRFWIQCLILKSWKLKQLAPCCSSNVLLTD